MTQARLTIGIPTRNRAALVAGLVDICQRQSLPAYEIIVSDNASDDDTIARLDGLPHPRLTVLCQAENIGMVGNWNACLARATGEWFILLSDDDLIASDFYAQASQAIAAAEDAEVLVMRCRVVDHISRQHNENHPPVTQRGKVDFLADILPAWLTQDFALPLAGFLFRTETLKARGGFSDSLPFAADIATWLPICFHNDVAFWPQAKIDYVVHAGMTTRTFDFATLVDDMLKIRELILNEIGRSTLPEARKEKLRRLADVNLKKSFAAMVMISARAGGRKRALLRVWLRHLSVLPGFGVTALSLGGLLVPQALLDIVGWPYRKWLKHRREATQKRRAGLPSVP